MNNKTSVLVGLILLLSVPFIALAEEKGGDAAQANNPLANMTAFNLQKLLYWRVN